MSCPIRPSRAIARTWPVSVWAIHGHICLTNVSGLLDTVNLSRAQVQRKRAPADYQGPTQPIRGWPRSDVQRIGPHRLNDQPHTTIQDKVQGQRIAVAPPFPFRKMQQDVDQDRGDHEGTDRLVEERRVESFGRGILFGPVFGVDPDAPRQAGWPSKRFLLRPVPPAADRLTNRHPGHDRVGPAQERLTMATADPPEAGDPADQRPVDRQAAQLYAYDPVRVVGKVSPFKHDVIEPGADDSRHDHDRSGIEQELIVLPATTGDPRRDRRADDEIGHDEQGVPADFEGSDGECDWAGW